MISIDSMRLKDQYSIFIEVHNSSPLHVGEDCYLTGSFNDWAMPGYRLGQIPPVGQTLSITMDDMPMQHLDVKLTRGQWETCQAYGDGEIADSISIDVSEKQLIRFQVKHWRDEFPKSTASPQVHLLADRFYLPHLDRHRRLWIYLPKEYDAHEKRYPVIYMHDGQHLFDEAVSVGRAGPVEWKVDETIDIAKFKAIVVGIEHADTYDERLDEFLIEPFENLKTPQGLLYLQDIVEAVKPYVDLHFRTLPDTEHTAVVGSSAGGLISLYAGLLYPNIFGTVGAFSPSLWMGHDLLGLYANMTAEAQSSVVEQAYYFYAGGREIRQDKNLGKVDLATDMQEFIVLFRNQKIADATVDIDPHGRHSALYWQRVFQRFYDWWSTSLKF